MKEVLEKWMAENGVKRSDLSRATGLPDSTISDILNGRVNVMNIGVSKVLKISEATGISVEALFGKSEPEPTTERETLTSDEIELLNLWRNATQESRSSVLMVLRCNQKPAKKEAVIL